MFGQRAALAAVISLIAAAAPASAATLHLKAPKEIDRAEEFRLTAFGKAEPKRDYYVSVTYHNNDQGRCGRTLEKEVTRNEHASIFDMRRVTTGAEGRFEITRRIVGGDKKVSGKFCGYLTNKDGENRDRVARPIAFT